MTNSTTNTIDSNITDRADNGPPADILAAMVAVNPWMALHDALGIAGLPGVVVDRLTDDTGREGSLAEIPAGVDPETVDQVLAALQERSADLNVAVARRLDGSAALVVSVR